MAVWQQTCQQLYLPRLLNDGVFHRAVQAGAEDCDFFGLAQGKEDDRYVGFHFGERTSIFLDTVLLIEPGVARDYANRIKEPPPDPPPHQPEKERFASREEAELWMRDHPVAGAEQWVEQQTDGRWIIRSRSVPTPPSEPPKQTPQKRHFYGNIDLDPILAKKQFADLVDEVLQQFTTQPAVKVRISVEIQADSATGFNSDLQRSVKENCNVLKFKNAEFELGEP